MPLCVIAALFALQFALPAYAHGATSRILTLALFAVAYNVAFGFAGLLSLGHAMLFAAGLYAAGLGVERAGMSVGWALLSGAGAGLALALVIGLVALRTRGVAFMIVTLMLAQAAYLAILALNDVTGGDEGFVLRPGNQVLGPLSLADPDVRYNLALFVFAVGYLLSVTLARSPIGRVLAGIRENEERVQLLGYDTFRYRLLALALSGLLAGLSGAAYALMFGYVGATFASVQYSILPLLWVLVGGSGTMLGPLVGTAAMFVLVDRLSGITSSYLIAVGAVLILLVVALPRGIVGTLRERLVRSRP
jgi:branched-chain amino acid transport system permease protein